MISICEFELSTYGIIKAPVTLPFKDMISWINNLNSYVITNASTENRIYSPVAVNIATTLMKAKGVIK